MLDFSGMRNPSGWLSLACGVMEKSKASPRLAAMQRLKAKRAAAKARAKGADQEVEPQEDQRPSKARKTEEEEEVHQEYAPPPSAQEKLSFELLAPPPPPPRSSKGLRRRSRPTTTLQLFPEAQVMPNKPIDIRRAWITRVDGERMSGWLRWSDRVDDIVITCDCHNLMFSPEGILIHAGLNGRSEDHPLRQIKVSTISYDQE